MADQTVTTEKEEILKERVDEAAETRVSIIGKEFSDGFEIIRKYPKSVSIFGSSRFTEDNPYYKLAQDISDRLAREGFAITTGGGPGIMEAGNRGAYDAGGDSIGFNIKLPMEQVLNPYTTDSFGFEHFFARKVLLAFSAEAYLFFPGGFGTLDELFEILTLAQTKKIPHVPIILVGNEYWGKLHEFICEELRDKYKTIYPEDTELYTITEDVDKIAEIACNAPLRQE